MDDLLRMESTLNIQVGRLRSHRDGGWLVIVNPTDPHSPIITRDDGSGLTLAEAEEALDRLEEWEQSRAQSREAAGAPCVPGLVAQTAASSKSNVPVRGRRVREGAAAIWN